ncbi:TetR/AcrR family transcriptional regulator [Gordonia sp. CPCC 206044]|uniref:TetR/AcrR family transcriptional regulator n=1 Tax=Gordonia sp. CPCC 206044 TaxID=3140793 RepID=UPI003AF37FDF
MPGPTEPVHAVTSSAVHPTDDPAAAELITAAVRTMAEKGYHGTSVRDIAGAAGVAVGSLYNYFGSKHGLLAVILNRGMDGLVETTESALLNAGTDPAERLRAIVGVHVRRHAESPLESLLGNSELRSLEPSAREVIVTKRDVQQRMFERVIADGVDRGSFHTTNPRETARFIITACTAVATWFRPDGPLTADEITTRYQAVALDAAGFRGPRS